jgi:hypothetical protein
MLSIFEANWIFIIFSSFIPSTETSLLLTLFFISKILGFFVYKDFCYILAWIFCLLLSINSKIWSLSGLYFASITTFVGDLSSSFAFFWKFWSTSLLSETWVDKILSVISIILFGLLCGDLMNVNLLSLIFLKCLSPGLILKESI